MKKKISKKFRNSGLILNKKIDKKLLKKKFESHGIILFRNVFKTFEEAEKLARSVSLNYSSNAFRRSKVIGSNIASTVDYGNKSIPLHSETSFTSNWPKIIWFYCNKAYKVTDGQTIFCDGIELWNKLSESTKKFFLQNAFTFELKIKIRKRNLKSRNWTFNDDRYNNSKIFFNKGFIKTNFTKYLVHKNKFSNDYIFSNHIFSALKKDEPQIKKFRLANKKIIPKNIINEINKLSINLTYAHNWMKNDFLMIDNRRFMHGRNKIRNLLNREIFLIQTSNYNFNKKN